MKNDWQTLTQMTQGKDLIVKKVEIESSSVQIEGSFELPPLAKLTINDQVFIAAFVKANGSIKEMERLFGVSYPTIKSRLANIGKQLSFIDVENVNTKEDVLDKLSRGEINVKEALKELQTK